MLFPATVRLMGLLVIVGMVAGCGEEQEASEAGIVDKEARVAGVYARRYQHLGTFYAEDIVDLQEDRTFTDTRRQYGSARSSFEDDDDPGRVTTWQSRGNWRVVSDGTIELTYTHERAWEGTDMTLLNPVHYGPLAEAEIVLAEVRGETMHHGTSADLPGEGLQLPRR